MVFAALSYVIDMAFILISPMKVAINIPIR